MNESNYKCALGLKASEGKPTGERDLGLFTHFDGRSNFDFDWNNSLTQAVEKAYTASGSHLMLLCALGAKGIGCHIGLSTSKETGIHELNLRCNYEK
nr:unnamed protein product [Haemonchus contortus]